MEHTAVLGNQRPSRRDRARRVVSRLTESFPEAKTIGLYGDATIEALSEQERNEDEALQELLQEITPLARISMEAARRHDSEELETIGRVHESEDYVATCVLE